MLLYRITKGRYLEVYSEHGGCYQDEARWSRPGSPVIYFALSAAVAILEMAIYTCSPRLVPASYRLGVYEVPDNTPIDRLNEDDWPAGWSQFPFPESTQAIGDQWLQEAGTVGLIVPSCSLSAGLGEIMVVNPDHSALRDIRLIKTRSDLFNPRAFSGLT